MSLTGISNGDRAMPVERAHTAKRYEVPEIVVGKDVLELVSSAMYVDPMTVYREYIQNAADAVDAARATGRTEGCGAWSRGASPSIQQRGLYESVTMDAAFHSRILGGS